LNHREVLDSASQEIVNKLFGKFYVDGDLEGFMTRYRKVTECKKAILKDLGLL
jgi:hypothetical protein